ncbi:MAG: carbohydrate ABC transporter substrate-binding protein [Betaproteobacteria bacterium]|jgi:glucose/mannose transport system substrate-binding protein|nr:MAG: carbohydrate ABC transporter substrate-binding protein [Betaproteobacteria bacterium]
MNLTRKLAVSACVVAVALSACSRQEEGGGEVEVLHWWTSGGEARSVAELKKMLEERGDSWKDFAVAGGGGETAMTVLKSRVVSGNPPTAAQVKGPGIQEWAREGVLANLNSVAQAGDWDNLLPGVVSAVMKYEGNYVAVPVNVHRVNWMWANPAVFEQAGANIPTTWDEFKAAADKIEAAGFIAVAHGGQPWQDSTLFESIALGIGGASWYQKAFVELDEAALNSPTMVKAFDTLRMVQSYIDKDAANRDWNLATAMVINGKAAMQFMGDWAKGEFTAADKVPGTDYICMPAPGTAGSFTFNIDSFIMFEQKDESAITAQAHLAEAIMDPAFQEVFNLNKGSIPVRLGMDLSKFDQCAKDSSAEFASSSMNNKLVPSWAHEMAMPPANKGAMFDVVTAFINTPGMSSNDAAAGMANAGKL